jgi:hypothetical protein
MIYTAPLDETLNVPTLDPNAGRYLPGLSVLIGKKKGNENPGVS